MTPAENYAQIVDQIFGIGKVTFNRNTATTNLVIGALNDQSNFNTFKKNFIARLERLRNLYEAYPGDLQNILVQVNEIASVKNWEGAFAELAAFDHLNMDWKTQQPVFSDPIKTNVDLNINSGLAKNLGKAAINLDGLISDFGIYFDVKTLKDNVDEILQGIFKQLSQHLGVTGLSIITEYSLDSPYFEFQKNRAALLQELKSKVNITDRPTSVSSKVIAGLNYRLQWNAGINQGISTYDPYQHARNLESGIFNYINKLLINKPTVLVFVTFPWYNLIINDFADMHLAFYRAYARRVFCQYKHNTALYSLMDSSYTGPETINQITQHISAIVFLEDKTIQGEDRNESNVKCYTYINPNALNPISRLAEDYFLNYFSNAMHDNFQNDNY